MKPYFKEFNIKTYTDIEQIGLISTNAISSICAHVPNNSILMCKVDQDFIDFDKFKTGIIIVEKINDGSGTVTIKNLYNAQEVWINRFERLEYSAILNDEWRKILAESEIIINENGTAIKDPEGTMICSKRVTFNNIPCTTVSGAIYITAQQSLGNFAEEFVDIPTMTVSKVRHDAGWIYNTNQISKTSAGYVTFATTTTRSTATFECHVIAMGRWK